MSGRAQAGRRVPPPEGAERSSSVAEKAPGALASPAMVAVIAGARSLPEPLKASVVTLGSFDGVHRGHQALIHAAVVAARARAIVAVGYTFHPHPAEVLAPDRAPKTLMGIDERAWTMGLYGLDYVLVEPFDTAFSQVSADDFIRDYLVAPLRPQHIVVGFNFTYGRGRGGDPAHLQAAGAELGFSVEVLEAVTVEGEVASSTAVRAFMHEGDVASATRLLGRPPALTGRVVTGDQRGRTIGFPTANIDLEGTLVPAFGVYACTVDILDDDGRAASQHGGVVNIGRRPTFGGGEVSAETFLLDFDGDLYGRRLRVALIARLRNEQKFSGIDALKQQLQLDVEAARTALVGQ